MSSVPQNLAILGFAKQSAKGTAATASTHRLFLAGGSQVMTNIVKEDFAELHGYQTPIDAYIASAEGAGDPEFYCYPSAIAALFLGILGADAPTGVSDPYSHEITESDEIPYWTLWASTGNGLFEKYVDAKLKSLKLVGDSNKPLMVTPSFLGGVPSYLTTEETTADVEVTDRFLYYDGLAALKVEGAAVPLMRHFELNLDRGTAVMPGDSMTPADALVGPLALTLGITTVPADFAEYNRVVYGSASPSAAAAPTQDPDTLAGSPAGFDLKFVRRTDRSLEIAIPNVQRDPFKDALSATPGPVVRSQNFKAYKPSDGSTIATVTAKNGDATIS